MHNNLSTQQVWRRRCTCDTMCVADSLAEDGALSMSPQPSCQEERSQVLGTVLHQCLSLFVDSKQHLGSWLLASGCCRCALSGAEHTVKTEFARSVDSLRDHLRLVHTWPHYSCFICETPELKQAHAVAQLPRVQSRRLELLMFEVFAVDRLTLQV